MRVLITGSNGFVGKNLVATLREKDDIDLFLYEKDDSLDSLELYVKDADFIVHLAGVNRPKTEAEFFTGNTDLTDQIVRFLIKYKNKAPILISSSIQASLSNAYGESKKLAEEKLIELEKINGNRIYIYRLPNLFGKWSRPYYNSVVATWCYQVAHNEPVSVNDKNVELELVYIDDFINEIMNCITDKKNTTADNYYDVDISHKITLGDLASIITSFNDKKNRLFIPDMKQPLIQKLYSTYLTYLDLTDIKYALTEHQDERGTFSEYIKSESGGQVSINVSKPGIEKGNHWHHSKHEKFLVVKGQAKIMLRQIFSEEITSYEVSDKIMEVIDIPPGYTHNIINIGAEDLVTVIWVNEVYDPTNPDTYYDKVVK